MAGGARGAYEVGALSVLVPVLQERGEHPTVLVGTSAGALNVSYLAAEAKQGFIGAVDSGCELWRELQYGEVLAPLLSVRDIRLAVQYGLEVLGLPVAGMRSLVDNAPLAETIKKRIRFDNLAEDVRSGVIETAAVVATSHDTGRSVAFHDGAICPLSS